MFRGFVSELITHKTTKIAHHGGEGFAEALVVQEFFGHWGGWRGVIWVGFYGLWEGFVENACAADEDKICAIG